MALRRKNNLRRTASASGTRNTVVRDMITQIERDGSDVEFEWLEHVGGIWNPTYEVWEGGESILKKHVQQGLGRVVDYKEDIVEYEWGRISVGEAIIRFPVYFDIEQYKDKTSLRMIFKGQRWKIDSPLGVNEYYADDPICKIIKGVKAVD